MRHLFVPACVCVMTWSGAVGADTKLSLDEFTNAARGDKKVVAHAAPSESPGNADQAQVQIPIDMTAAELALEAPAADAQAKIAALPIPLPPIPKPVVQRSHAEICDSLTKAAETNNVPVPFFINLLFQESRFEAGVVSSAGAQGIAQFMPETATSMGLDNPFDPVQAIPASARLLRELIHQFGNLGLAAAAYNAGPKRIQDWLDKKGKLPQETQGYVKTITGRPAETWTAATAAYPGRRVPRHAPCQEAAGLYAANGPETIPLPAASPRTQHAATMSVASNSSSKNATKSAPKPVVVASAGPSIKISHHGGRVTAVIEVAKADHAAKPKDAKAEKPATQQLAARKQKTGKHKLEKLAQR
jgi:soluble lytic murein transglycosylase-like protein